MAGKTLITEPHITIAYDFMNEWLRVDWTGEQTEQTVKDGCLKMLDCLKEERCSKVLNDNTLVTGMWSGAADWGAKVWFPEMYANGCHYFAWVYSPDVYSKLSTDLTLNQPIRHIIISTFDEISTAKAWLKVI